MLLLLLIRQSIHLLGHEAFDSGIIEMGGLEAVAIVERMVMEASSTI